MDGSALTLNAIRSSSLESDIKRTDPQASAPHQFQTTPPRALYTHLSTYYFPHYTTTITQKSDMTTTQPTPLSTKYPFPFPREHSFPPFFTLQPQSSTLHAQLQKWSSLILAYHSHYRIFRLSISASLNSELFYNARINRRLDEKGVREVLEFMKREGRAEGVAAAGKAVPRDAKEGDVYWIWWRKPEEWARALEEWVEGTGQKGSVLTLYELVEGEGTRDAEFHGLDPEILQKALAILVKRGKAQVFGQEDQQGVKFF
ncbi:vacuolar -sorting-associated protein [Rutstroemia sp. NJR-2017a BBW]|nr:vacuolar -sorting-associated protein [Rutstroemia sp. NJR-2017a BBW]